MIRKRSDYLRSLMDRATVKKFAQFLESKKIKEAYKIVRIIYGPMRFKIVILLDRNHKEGFTVTELSQILNASLSRISHQLRILKRHKLVNTRGENREVIYTLANHRIRKQLTF